MLVFIIQPYNVQNATLTDKWFNFANHGTPPPNDGKHPDSWILLKVCYSRRHVRPRLSRLSCLFDSSASPA